MSTDKHYHTACRAINRILAEELPMQSSGPAAKLADNDLDTAISLKRISKRAMSSINKNLGTVNKQVCFYAWARRASISANSWHISNMPARQQIARWDTTFALLLATYRITRKILAAIIKNQ